MLGFLSGHAVGKERGSLMTLLFSSPSGLHVTYFPNDTYFPGMGLPCCVIYMRVSQGA